MRAYLSSALPGFRTGSCDDGLFLVDLKIGKRLEQVSRQQSSQIKMTLPGLSGPPKMPTQPNSVLATYLWNPIPSRFHQEASMPLTQEAYPFYSTLILSKPDATSLLGLKRAHLLGLRYALSYLITSSGLWCIRAEQRHCMF
jgi:hypothetical protein